MTRLLVALSVLLSLEAVAAAQATADSISISSFNPDDAVAETTVVEGPGVKIGEGTVLHPVFGIETGFVSNVFYQDTNTQPSGVLRLIAQVGAASLSTARLAPMAAPDADDPQENHGSVQYRANLRLSYDQMLSGNEIVRSTGGLGVGAALHGLVNSDGRWAFGFDEDFHRLIRATNFETDANTNRDINDLRLLMLYRPRGSAVSGYLYYMNRLDLFERTEQSFASRMSNRGGVRPTWRFLPQTLAYLDLSFGITQAIDTSSMKPTSYPLIARAGLATLLTLNLTLNLDAGYTNGFYTKGPSFSAPMIGAELGYRYSPLGRASFGYSLVYEDSINANYYRDNVLRASIQQVFAPFVLMAQPEVHFRQYNGVTFVVPGITGPDTRNDTIFALIAGITYNFRNWIAVTANYKLTTDQTNFVDNSGGMPDDPSYTRHELLFGMRVAM
jgi:hypothetical protein